MKNYTITVNGNVYNVTVEEGTASAAAVKPAAPAPVAAPAPSAKPEATPAEAPAPAPAKSTGAEGSVKVEAPMSGKILAVKASAGQAVKKGDVVVVLEAMKMENDIVAPADGTIASVNCSVGDHVDSGAVLVTLN